MRPRSGRCIYISKFVFGISLGEAGYNRNPSFEFVCSQGHQSYDDVFGAALEPWSSVFAGSMWMERIGVNSQGEYFLEGGA